MPDQLTLSGHLFQDPPLFNTFVWPCAGGSESEEEDPEELVMIDESDNEGGNISGMDTEPEV